MLRVHQVEYLDLIPILSAKLCSIRIKLSFGICNYDRFLLLQSLKQSVTYNGSGLHGTGCAENGNMAVESGIFGHPFSPAKDSIFFSFVASLYMSRLFRRLWDTQILQQRWRSALCYKTVFELNQSAYNLSTFLLGLIYRKFTDNVWFTLIIFCSKSQSSQRKPRISPMRQPVPNIVVISGSQWLYW